MKFNIFDFLKTRKSAVGIDISDRSIKALLLRKESGGKIVADAFSYLSIEEGVIENAQILDEEKLATIINELFEKGQPHSIPKDKILVSLPDSKAFIKTFKVDISLKDQPLEDKIRELSAESIPFEPEALYFDFEEVGIDKEKGEKEILFVGSPKEAVDKYVEVFKKIGLENVIFDIESASLARALLGKEDESSSVLILDMGARTTNLNLIDKGKICLNLTFPSGGNQLTKKIATNLKLSFEEADRLKMSLGLDKKSGENNISPIINSFCTPLIENIKQESSYYEKRTGRKIETMIICGGSSLMTGIDACLEEKTGLKVKRIDPWIKWQIEISQESDKIYFRKEAPVLYANVIGLALRGLDKDPSKAGFNLLKYKGQPLSS